MLAADEDAETTAMIDARSVARAYGKQKSDGQARLQRLLSVYDAGLDAAESHNLDLLTRTLDLLNGTLDFSAGPELAMSLSQLYGQCRKLAEAGEFGRAANILAELRAAFASGKT